MLQLLGKFQGIESGFSDQIFGESIHLAPLLLRNYEASNAHRAGNQAAETKQIILNMSQLCMLVREGVSVFALV